MRTILLLFILALTQVAYPQDFIPAPVNTFGIIRSSFPSLPPFVFADVDGDNDQDVLIRTIRYVAPSGQFIPGRASFYTNDGAGTFSEAAGTPFEGVSSSSIAFADVDGDDGQDVLIKGENSSGDRISILYVNDGTGAFSEVAGTPFNWGAGSVAFADVDGDDDQDVLISNRLYINTTMIVSNSNIQPFNNEEGIIYPNPGLTGVVAIDYIASQYGELTINVFDLTGKLMHKESAEVINGQNILQLDIGGLNPGTYFIQLSNEINISTVKLIVQ